MDDATFSYPPIDPTTFDLIVVGTGLPESILSAAAASTGKTVLHLDPNHFYGSHFSSLPLSDLPSFLLSHSQPAAVSVPTDLTTSSQSDADDGTTPSQSDLVTVDLTTRPVYSDVEISSHSADLLDHSRKFNLDLTGPRVLFCADSAVDLMLKSGANQYVEFKNVDGTFVCGGDGKLSSVPDSRSAIFKDSSLGLAEKNRLGSFFKLVEGHLKEVGSDGGSRRISEEDLERPFIEFLDKMRLPVKIKSIIIYAIAMADYDQDKLEGCKNVLKTREGINRLALYHSSVGRFHNALGALIYPIYGQGELSQAFCRRAAVKGCLYVLRMPVKALLMDKESGSCKGAKVASGQDLFSNEMVLGPSFITPLPLANSLPDFLQAKLEDIGQDIRGKVARAICITNSSLKTDVSTCLVVYPPKSLYPEQVTSIRVLQIGSSLVVCPSGMFVVYLSTLCDDAIHGKKSLHAAINTIFSVATSETAEYSSYGKSEDGEVKPNLLWSALYIQELFMGSFDPFCFTPMPDGSLNYNDLLDSTKEESPEGQKMLEFRRSLPAYKEKDALLNFITQNQVVVVSGETGCGKTTQLPQYILESEIEDGHGASCSIICTQPRQISAMSVAERVAAERGENLGESVGYKVRLEGMKGRDTRLLFCTTGILLRRLLVDRSLKGISHVVVDEIHERGMNEDFLLIVLKELLPRRPELRLILMSATLNAELFSSYFGGAPMIHIPGFTYPVRSHFLENILEATGYRLTSYNQIDNYGQEKMWKMQKQSLRKRKSQIASAVEDALEAADFMGYGPRTRESLSCWNPDSIGFNLIEHVLCHILKKERPGAVLVFMTGWDDINSLKDQLQAHPLLGDPSRVLLLACHGSMASSEQRLIFDKPEDGVRKIVLATNMAETSITINDVVFVVDCGKAKETSYDALNNTPCLLPSWISKASAHQRRGRAGRVQPGDCYHLYPQCVHDAFADYQLPELLRTPLQSLCLQIKTLQLGSISEFLARALQPPEPLSVQNAIEYLMVIGALDENENLTVLGRNLSMLPVEPKLGKMLLFGAIFNCLDSIMTVVAGLSARDPFLMPFDKKDLAESAKAQFSSRDYSDHLALVRAYDGWKDAERHQSGYEYCWKNFLSAQTLKAIDSLRKQFFYLLKDIGLLDNPDICNTWSHDEHLIRAIICAGLFPGICSVVNKEKSISLKTMEDGQVLLYSNSVNAQEPKIPHPWLVFNEKVKVNSVFLRDSTAVSDSVVLLFGGNVSRGGLDGHLKMLGGYLEFFMDPALADTYLRLKKELEELIQKKLFNPKLDMKNHNELLLAIRLLISEDRSDGKFVFGRQLPSPSKEATKGTLLLGPHSISSDGVGGDNSKNQLQTLLARAGHGAPSYKTTQLKNNKFRSTVIFNGLNFVGQSCNGKKLAEKDAAAQALEWLMGETQSSKKAVDHMSMLLKKSKKKQPVRATKWR